MIILLYFLGFISVISTSIFLFFSRTFHGNDIYSEDIYLNKNY